MQSMTHPFTGKKNIKTNALFWQKKWKILFTKNSFTTFRDHSLFIENHCKTNGVLFNLI